MNPRNFDFEWSDKKAVANLKKHGVSFEEAETAFDNPFAVILDDEFHSDDEAREILIGYSERTGSYLFRFSNVHDFAFASSVRGGQTTRSATNMNKKNASNPRRPGHEHIPGLDDYELPPHIEVDYSKAKPNRFAGRVKFTHGGKRTGAGRKPRLGLALIQKSVRLTRDEIDYLVQLGGNLSEGIHMLIKSQRAGK